MQHPADGQELYWLNTRTIPKPYRGPREVRFEQDFDPSHDVKLALTRCGAAKRRGRGPIGRSGAGGMWLRMTHCAPGLALC